ncbi:MAG: hypothetical protein L6R36_008717, partial [Xanthoria steineri]
MAVGPPASIAIVGIGLRLPGDVTDLDGFGSVLTEGRNCWTSVPSDRYNESAYLHPKADAPATHNHRGGHFLSQNLAAFDASFFQIPPAEAQAMDPQQRILLETTYDAFQSCGSTLESVRGSNTAVYIATFSSDYDRIIQKDTDDIPRYHTTGTGEAIAANRISYAFDLRGPSVALDTGCSGSLAAVHHACQSLITGEVETAIAGGVNLILNPDRMIGMANLGMLNAEGRSYPFDHRGSGYGRGEGSAVVILKTLNEALRCGDPIRGLIRSTAINQDGKTLGITSPSQMAQEVLLRRIYEKASPDPRTIHYVEAHGTGTRAGDEAEIGAIGAVFCKDRTSPLYVGSVKSNISHLESASGLAGMIKAVLTLEKGTIFPNADFQMGKPDLDLQGYNITIPVNPETFPEGSNRRAAVNSFGYGGTNAHLILEEASSVKQIDSNPRSFVSLGGEGYLNDTNVRDLGLRLFVLSTSSEVSLRAMVHRVNSWTSLHKADIDLGDLAFTLLLRRSHLEWRAQWYAMGRELMTRNITFKESLEKSQSVLCELGALWNLTDELLFDESTSRVDKVWLAQPASTAIQIALVDLLRNLGIRPHTVIGHSSGEIAAAYATGFLSQAAAMQVSYYRGLVCKITEDSKCFKGAMLAVGLSERKVVKHIRQLSLDDLSVACINSPASTTISGGEASINNLHGKCQEMSIFSRKLNVGTAYHSHYMDDASVQYRKYLSSLEVMAPEGSQNFISTVTAMSKKTGFGPEYWTENLTSKVLFADAVSKSCHLQHKTGIKPVGRGAKQMVIEIGPHPALSGAFRQTVEHTAAGFDYSYVPSLVRGTCALSSFLRLLGQLYENGVTMDLDRVLSISPTKPYPAVIHSLPPYPWNHSKSYWHESRLSKQSRFRRHGPHYLLGTQTNSSTPLEPCWRHLVGVDSLPWLQDHTVDNLKVLPGAAYICMAVEAARQLFAEASGLPDFGVVLKNVNFWRVLVIPEAP